LAKVPRDWGWVYWEEDDTPPDVRHFNVAGKSALLWLERSRSLHFAAAAVRAHSASNNPKVGPFGFQIALMLGGLAVETILKMVIVADYCETHGFRRDSREAKEFVPPIHDLTKLVTKAKLRINKADRDTLGELTSFSVWRGKYPTPLSATAYTPAVLDASIGRERLWKRYDALYRKLHRLAVRKSFPEAIRAPRRAQARR
jgi:hypothetical protein